MRWSSVVPTRNGPDGVGSSNPILVSAAVVTAGAGGVGTPFAGAADVARVAAAMASPAMTFWRRVRQALRGRVVKCPGKWADLVDTVGAAGMAASKHRIE
jgi:hypothetical protein